jgi:fumarate reductase subunit C
VKSAAARAEPTRTAPAPKPEGFWIQHPRYRSYVLFAGTGALLWLGALVLARGLFALGEGVAAWNAYLAALGSPAGVVAMVVIFAATVFFALRFLWIGIKVATVDLGPIPAPPAPVIFVLHYAGLAALTGLLLLVASGVIL